MKIFRKTRQKLASENKVSSYLRYAIGEIVLVVIGILIALQVNNWNELTNNRKEEISILKDLKSELKHNQKLIKKSLADHQSIFNRSTKVLSMINTGKYETNQVILDTLMEAFIFPPIYSPSQSVVNTITSSGKLSLIENKEITYKLNQISGLLEDYYHWANTDNENVNELNTPYILDRYPVKSLLRKVLKEPPSNFKPKTELLFHDVKLESLFELRRVNATVIIQSLKEIELQQEQLINLITNELSKNTNNETL